MSNNSSNLVTPKAQITLSSGKKSLAPVLLIFKDTSFSEPVEDWLELNESSLASPIVRSLVDRPGKIKITAKKTAVSMSSAYAHPGKEAVPTSVNYKKPLRKVIPFLLSKTDSLDNTSDTTEALKKSSKRALNNGIGKRKSKFIGDLQVLGKRDGSTKKQKVMSTCTQADSGSTGTMDSEMRYLTTLEDRSSSSPTSSSYSIDTQCDAQLKEDLCRGYQE